MKEKIEVGLCAADTKGISRIILLMEECFEILSNDQHCTSEIRRPCNAARLGYVFLHSNARVLKDLEIYPFSDRRWLLPLVGLYTQR